MAQLRVRAGADGYGEDGTDLAAVVLELLRARKARLVVAESCTGGLVSGRITAVPEHPTSSSEESSHTTTS